VPVSPDFQGVEEHGPRPIQKLVDDPPSPPLYQYQRGGAPLGAAVAPGQAAKPFRKAPHGGVPSVGSPPRFQSSMGQNSLGLGLGSQVGPAQASLRLRTRCAARGRVTVGVGPVARRPSAAPRSVRSGQQ